MSIEKRSKEEYELIYKPKRFMKIHYELRNGTGLSALRIKTLKKKKKKKKGATEIRCWILSFNGGMEVPSAQMRQSWKPCA